MSNFSYVVAVGACINHWPVNGEILVHYETNATTFYAVTSLSINFSSADRHKTTEPVICRNV